MPTSTARIGTERDLASLARNLYVIEGENRAAMQRRAERALLRGNPQLARPEAFVEGALIIVPNVTGLRLTARVSNGETGIDGLLEQAAARLQVAARTIDEGFRNSDERRKASLRLSEDQGFRESARKAFPESLGLIESAVKSMNEGARVSSARARALRAAVESAISEIKRFNALMTPPSNSPEP